MLSYTCDRCGMTAPYHLGELWTPYNTSNEVYHLCGRCVYAFLGRSKFLAATDLVKLKLFEEATIKTNEEIQ